MARTSFLMMLLGCAAAVALLLSAIGIYGVISYVVTQRRAEIGVRMALGATARDVLRLVMRQSVILSVLGIAAGLLSVLALGRLLPALLFDVSPADPTVLSAVTVLLFLIALLASALPAIRATRIDPGEAMRSE